MTDQGDPGAPDTELPSPFALRPEAPDAGASTATPTPTEHGSNTPAPRAQVGRDTISGIPAFWGDNDGPFTATLSFRVGEADETLRTRGLCKVIAQLASAAIDDERLDISTSVSALQTSFTIDGEIEEVTTTLTRLARTIAALPTERIDEAIAEILAEWTPPRRWDIELMTLRFGARGYGLPACEYLGLNDLDPTTLENWLRAWFTGGNAVVIFSSEPSPSTDLGALAGGDRKPLPEPHPIDLELPALHPGPDHTVAASFLCRGGQALDRALGLVASRLRSRFVDLDPRVGDVDIDVQPTGPGHRTVTIFVPAPDELAGEVREIISSELFRFSMNGPSRDEIDQAELTDRRSQLLLVDDTARLAEQEAIDDLYGTPDEPRPREVDPEELATIVRRMCAQGIWLMPRSVAVADHRLARIPEGSDVILEGNVFAPVPEIAAARQADRLVVATTGLTLLIAGSLPATVRFADLVAVQHWADGARTVWGDDGIRFLVHPGAWLGGPQVVEWIDAQVEAWLAISMGTPSGYTLPIDPPAVPAR